jgi:hypothetical protein
MSDVQYESQVAVPHEYFHNMSKMDYGDPHRAFIRELFQNSVDAGATKFILAFDYNEREIIAIDDGCGMNEDIIRNRLLVMGGSHKDKPDAIGAFGHAKILIYFSWESYEIRTTNIRVFGKSNRYSIEYLDDTINGTVSTVKIADAEDFQRIYRAVRTFFLKCDTNVDVTLVKIDGDDDSAELVKQNLKILQPIPIQSKFMNINIGTSFGVSEWNNQYVYVRSNGVYMFENWSNVLKNPIIVETIGSARDLFTQNRDSLKREYGEEFQTLISKINADNVSMTNSALQSFFNTQIKEPDKRKKTKERKELLPVLNGTFLCWGKTEAEWNLYYRKQRVKKIKYFMEHVVEHYRTKTQCQEKIRVGFVFDSSVDGVLNHQGTDLSTVFLNPIRIEKFNKDKREMVYEIIDIICHELAHFETIIHEGQQYHNESFNMRFHKIKKIFWDIDVWYKKFKICCKTF